MLLGQLSTSARAQNYDAGFLKNDGQEKNIDGSYNSSLLYTTQINNSKIYFTKTGISFVVSKKATNTLTEKDSIYRMEMSFLNSNAFTTCSPSQLLSSNTNFYIGALEKVDVPEYGKITYTNLWNNISLDVFFTQTGIQLNYRLAVGANPSLIQLKFNGGSNLALQSGNLSLNLPFQNPVNVSKFLISQTSGNLVAISASSSLVNGNEWKLNTTGYNSNNTYEVKQDIINFTTSSQQQVTSSSTTFNNKWTTYYGGNRQDYIVDTHISVDNKIYTLGITTSSDFPFFAGALFPVVNIFGIINSDLVITCFNTDRSRLFQTFYGGTGSETAGSIAVNSQGLVYFCGTTSSPDYPCQPGNVSTYFTDSIKSQEDAFITKLSANGKYKTWSTFFGSNDYDVASGLAIGNDDKVYMVGYSQGSNIPIRNLTNGFNQSYSQCQNTLSSTNGFIAKFSNTDNLEWSTYYGGSNSDNFQSCVIDKFNNLIVRGSSSSIGNLGGCGIFSLAMAVCGPTGSYLQNNSNSIDDYIAKFNPQGQVVWATFFGGSLNEYSENHNNSLMTTPQGDIFMVGNTSGNLPMPTYTNSQTNYGGGGDGYIIRFRQDGSRKWSSYLGGSGYDEVRAICPGAGNGYIVGGRTVSTNFGVVNNNADFYQSTIKGLEDGFLNIYNFSNLKTFSSYFGSTANDEILTISSANDGSNIVLGGSTFGTGLPVKDFNINSSLDFYDPSFNGGFIDGFISNLVFNYVSTPCGPDPLACKTALENSSDLGNLIVYPNPSDGLFEIKLNNFELDANILIYNTLGELIYSQLLNKSNSIINLKDKSSGLYYMVYSSNSKRFTKKIIIN